MNTGDVLFVAETDELGQIVCVWRSDKTTRAPRPIKNPNKHLVDVLKAKCTGATREEIANWFFSDVESTSTAGARRTPIEPLR